jgi:hypothetical protein
MMNLDLEQVREEVAEAVEQGSLRGVAREIGMSPTGLKKYLGGTDPYGPTLRKLVPWYEKRALRPRPAPEAQLVARSVDVLLADFSEVEQAPLRAELATMLDQAYTGMDGGAEAAGIVRQVRSPEVRAAQQPPRQTTAGPPNSTGIASGPRVRAPRRRLPVAQRLVAIGGAAQAG